VPVDKKNPPPRVRGGETEIFAALGGWERSEGGSSHLSKKKRGMRIPSEKRGFGPKRTREKKASGERDPSRRRKGGETVYLTAQPVGGGKKE